MIYFGHGSTIDLEHLEITEAATFLPHFNIINKAKIINIARPAQGAKTARGAKAATLAPHPHYI